jgi:hypothetical protein
MLSAILEVSGEQRRTDRYGEVMYAFKYVSAVNAKTFDVLLVSIRYPYLVHI